MTSNRTLEDFRDWYLNHQSEKVLEHRDYGKLVADVVYREGLFQVERVTVSPNFGVAAHRHPNIDAYESIVSGDLAFLIHPNPDRLNSALSRIKPRSMRRLAGKFFHVRSTDWHAAKAGTAGAQFLSIQKWTGVVPMTAAGVDWEGPPML